MKVLVKFFYYYHGLKKNKYLLKALLKPLIEHLLKIFTKEGSMVIDPFLGSGTTAVACQKTKRKCLGIERESEYIKICFQRLDT